MQWIAPSEKDSLTGTLEKRLWDSAGQFRANSSLKAQEYSGPILGIIFLRFAEVRFAQHRAKLELPSPSGRGAGGEGAAVPSRRGSRVDQPEAYHAAGVLFLPPHARFDFLLNLPEAADIGAKVNEAMRDIEKHNPQLAGVLPKTYNLFTSTLLKELLKKVSEIPSTVDYDAFGRIYEYFLGEFARTEGQKGGEFYTPSCIVRLLTEIIEPYHGRILDPACGSGGMFVQSARFVSEHKASPPSTRPVGHPSPSGRKAGSEGSPPDYSGDPARELSIHGVEKTDETGRLCRMNLAVHGLEGDIRHGGQINSYYDDPFDACGAGIEPSTRPAGHPSPTGRRDGDEGSRKQTGRFDFVLANPPFNVNAVDKERLKDAVGPARRFPFGLPKTDNANYLWIQLFYSSLNAKGRAGFVMANSASDARSSEQEIRQKLIESRAVDVMVAVGPNMFYTVTLPCTLWFFDKAKAALPPPSPQPSPTERGSAAADPPSPSGRRAGDEGKQDRANTVLFIDARHIYRQIDRAHRDWTPAQIGFLANLVRLYRGEEPDFTLGGDEAKAKLLEVFAAPPSTQPASHPSPTGSGSASTNLPPPTGRRPAAANLPSPAGRRAGDEGAARYRDIPGLCKAATLKEIEAQGWSLNPGRYVGVAPGEAVSDEDFKEQLETLNEELETLNAQARELERTIAQNVAEILET